MNCYFRQAGQSGIKELLLLSENKISLQESLASTDQQVHFPSVYCGITLKENYSLLHASDLYPGVLFSFLPGFMDNIFTGPGKNKQTNKQNKQPTNKWDNKEVFSIYCSRFWIKRKQARKQANATNHHSPAKASYKC